MKIIAYGSLMNQASLESTLGRPAQLQTIGVPGYRRVFNAPFDGFAFLNLQRVPGSSLDAAWFELSEAETAKFAEREARSELLELVPGCYAFVWPNRLTRDLPVLQSYINVCRTGATALGINFAKGLTAPTSVIDDVRSPLYP